MLQMLRLKRRFTKHYFTIMWFIVYVIFLNCVLAEDTARLVVTSQGPVRGYKDKENDIFIFYNIPYATAPTGSNRFRAPEPPPSWTEPLEAVNKEIICPQSDFILQSFKTKNKKENCLITTVYVPDTKVTDLPVYVYIHGGGYAFGFGDLTTPKKLVSSKKIIAVTFNYRLGPHGFLCLGTENVPGNAGMKDQVALLKWVAKNIASFCGNPDDVTLGGGSAGSAAADLLLLSKMTDGLFKKVIIESGPSTAPFNIQSDPIENAKEYGKLLKFENVNDVASLEKQFQNTKYENLFSNDYINRTDFTFLASPCLEKDVGQEIFLDTDPVKILKSGEYKKLPLLYGFTDMEGLMRLNLFDDWKYKMNVKFSDFLPHDLKFKNEKEREEIALRIKRFYFGDKDVSENILGYIDYFTDAMFTYPALRGVKLQVEAGNDQIYLYEFTYVEEKTPAVPNTTVKGANHCDQSMTVMDDFNVPGSHEVIHSDENEKVRQLYRKVWLDFIITGKPVPEYSNLPMWPPVKADLSPHMSLNKTMELKGSLAKERMIFWEDIYKKHYRSPISPNPEHIHYEL